MPRSRPARPNGLTIGCWKLLRLGCVLWIGVATRPAFAEQAPEPTAVAPIDHVGPADDGRSLPPILETHVPQALSRWEKDVTALETAAAERAADPNTILVVGSSSVRLWADHIEHDMAPYVVDRRGYGGASYIDIAVFADRLLRPQPYRALVLFAGNDVRGREDDHTPEEVTAAVNHVVGVSRRYQSDAPVLLIEVTPTPKRSHLLDQTMRINTALREYALSTPHVYFLPTWSHYTWPDGTLNAKYFDDDRLHQSREGYRMWSRLIRNRLNEVLRCESQFRMRGAAASEVN